MMSEEESNWRRLLLTLQCPECGSHSLNLTDGFNPVWNCQSCKLRWPINPPKKKEERILCAAIWFDDGQRNFQQPRNIDTGFVLCGHRHLAIIEQLKLLGKKETDFPKYTEGFITNTNIFANRKQAGMIAWRAGQTKERKVHLTSEDLY